MFWRFGFHNGSAIDSLLDKEDVSLEAILDEDDLLQECKSQNTRLINYFQRVDVLHRLLGYVTGQIENEERGRFKYPYVATEVLCSEIWSIVETCVNHENQLLVPFWETVLDRSAEDMKTQMVMASHFVKVTSVFLGKKPMEMLAFIKAQPLIVEKLLRHIETPSFVDLLIRIIQLDEHPEGAGVLEWLSSENFISRLVDLLSPHHTSDVHTVVAELIKNIITMATPSPGAGISDGLQNGPASNRFARELAQRDTVQKMMSYILFDFGPHNRDAVSVDEEVVVEEENIDLDEHQSENGSGFVVRLEDEGLEAGPQLKELGGVQQSEEGGFSGPPRLRKPTVESATSSVVNTISIIIELIRKNNSDYFEPYLFHSLRNRLIQIQQQIHMHTEDGREALERAMQEMVDRMGVVHFGPLLEIMCGSLGELQKFLGAPRSVNGTISTTIGEITPLTLERYRICELFAELLHCSNMSILNRPSEYNYLYDSQGRLQGGLSSLEGLAQVISLNQVSEREREAIDQPQDESEVDLEPALELPISGRPGSGHGTSGDSDSRSSISPTFSSDDSMSDGDEPGSSDEDAMEEIAMFDEPASQLQSLEPVLGLGQVSASQRSGSMDNGMVSSPASYSPEDGRSRGGSTSTYGAALTRTSSHTLEAQPKSRRSSKRTMTLDSVREVKLFTGELLKRRYVDMNIVSTFLELFFEFPWNNFLHSAVYDLIHQILTGNVVSGLNRELAIALFRDGKLMYRIVEGQKRNDVESAKPKGVRLGYMGHLTLISEDVIAALERYPDDLRQVLMKYTPGPEWEEYVSGRFNETKKRDTSLLGGGKPVVTNNAPKSTFSRWQVDEDEVVVEGGGVGHHRDGVVSSSSASGPGIGIGMGSMGVSPAASVGVSPFGVGGEVLGGFTGSRTMENGQQVKGEFKRAGMHPPRATTADFGNLPSPDEGHVDDDDDEDKITAPRFASYLAQEIHSSDAFGSSSSDEDEEEGWLSYSNFGLGLNNPPVSARHMNTERRPLGSGGSSSGFGVSSYPY
ncbi:hypothetical protein AMATHDRAFT_65352 [Amanita thiersii Skay4041]|uniref:SAPS-domain-containing protein n=1 Tax=Amanita thiersii Skay4041 TaxID=703135 RepID=A0A2A9NGR7_9AGAR|nr:hypothetical protein AMATHDRAFT_65352 [Amanita thiersii Skay4041]